MGDPINQLSELITELPGIGPRQARRVVQFLLRADAAYKKKLIESIESIADHVSRCTVCFRFAELRADKHCALCLDKERDQETLMVVEKDVDVESVENAHVYKGRYFVLGSLMPLARQRKNNFTPRVGLLKTRLAKDANIKEIILAFATTVEGDYTAHEITVLLRESFPHLTVSMLGRGLSLGAEIEYADHETLRSALQGRH